MRAQTAHEIPERLAFAINAGDLQGALELWESDAKLISSDGSEVCGRNAIGAVLQTLMSTGTEVELRLHSLCQTASTAVATGTLTMRIQASDGESLTQTSESMVIYRRDEDGFWRVAIDFPWGVPMSSPPD